MSLSICAVFKNEGRYLREWIEFHKIVGVETFYLYENGSSDEWQTVLSPYMQDGTVKVVDWSTGPGRLEGTKWQVGAYQDFIDSHPKTADWVAFIDCDEFLFSPTAENVRDLLKRVPFCAYGAIAVNWMCFGGGGETRFRAEPVIERFVMRSTDEDRINSHVKTIVRMDCVLGTTTSPHCFRVRGGTRGERGEHVSGSFKLPATHEYLRINHYLTKSREEWDQKHPEGFRVDFTRDQRRGYFEDYQEAGVRDTDILQYLPAVRQRLGFNPSP